MLPCINQATVLTTDTLKFLELARKHSLANVELDVGKVEECIKKDGSPALKKTLKENGINVVSLNAIENYPIMTAEDMSKSLERCERFLQVCSLLECEVAVVNPNEFEASQRAAIQQRFDAFVTETGKIAEKNGVRLAFEFVSYDNRVINSLGRTIECLNRWGGGTGLVLDVFHLYRSKESIGIIPPSAMSMLWAFHVNDAPDKPIEQLQDSDRVFPFEGVVNVSNYILELKQKRYTGPVSVELFNKEYWDMNADFVIARARESLEGLHVM